MARATPAAKYRVMTSFGGKTVSRHKTLSAAKKAAKSHARKSPVDVWSAAGGAMGQGKVVTHYGPERNPRAGPSAIPTRWTPAMVVRKGGQIQIRMGGR